MNQYISTFDRSLPDNELGYTEGRLVELMGERFYGEFEVYAELNGHRFFTAPDQTKIYPSKDVHMFVQRTYEFAVAGIIDSHRVSHEKNAVAA